jgi:hypothetical protein
MFQEQLLHLLMAAEVAYLRLARPEDPANLSVRTTSFVLNSFLFKAAFFLILKIKSD